MLAKLILLICGLGVSTSSLFSQTQNPQWTRLLFYQGNTSIVQDPLFYLSPDGATNPQAELDAAKKSFWDPGLNHLGDDHPQCRFPRRYAWVKKNLGLTGQDHKCQKLQNWLGNTRAHTMSLVFSSYYVSNPASLFGHTFFRFHSAKNGTKTSSPLLDWIVNYSAQLEDEKTDPFSYIWKGLTGGFHGSFSMTPYYIKIEEYNHWEQRDLWEYELNLTPAQIDDIRLSLWELGPVGIDYYFLSQNCSYLLLMILDSLSNESHYAAEFPLWVIPADTVRTIANRKDMIRKISYRPSLHSEFAQSAKDLPPADMNHLKNLLTFASYSDALAQVRQIPKERQIQILDAAERGLDVQLEVVSKKVFTPEENTWRQEILQTRANLPEASTPLVVHRETERLDLGHPSQRIGIGARLSKHNAGILLQWRPALHDLLSPAVGYPRLLELTVFETNLLLELPTHSKNLSLTLDDFHMLELFIPRPLRTLEKKPTWFFDLGVNRTHSPFAKLALGASLATPDNELIAYALPIGHVGYDHEKDHRGVRFGLLSGVNGQVSGNWILATRLEHYFWPEPSYESSLNLSFRMSTNHEWRLSTHLPSGAEAYGQLSLFRYF